MLLKGYREEIMEVYHDYPQAGHIGKFKLIESIAQKYWWPSIAKEIREWVKSCLVCQHFRAKREKRMAKLTPITVENLFETIEMDIISFKKASKEGNRYVVVITDYYTKWAEAYPIKDMKAETVARVLIRNNAQMKMLQ